MSNTNHSDIIVRTFNTIFTPQGVDVSGVERFFTDSYQQSVDGKQFGYVEFIQHLQTLSGLTERIDIEFLELADTEQGVFSLHLAHVLRADGHCSTTQVLAYFGLKNGKIATCTETTQLIDGAEADRSLSHIRG